MPAVRKTTDQQLSMLLDFMQRNVDIAHAKVPAHGKAVLLAKWTELSHKLNGIGPPKPPVYWRHYWHEMKYKTKLKAMKVKKSIMDCEDIRVPKFTDFEVRLLNIMGVEVPKRPRSPIPVVVRRRSQSAVGSDDDPTEKLAVVWDHKYVKTKTEPGCHENMADGTSEYNDPFPQSLHSGSHENRADNSEYNDPFPQSLHSQIGNFSGLQDSTHNPPSDDSSVLAWAHQLEKRRIDSENRMADAMFAIAKSQSEMAEAQRLMADALDGIRKDIKMYLKPDSLNPATPQGAGYAESQ